MVRTINPAVHTLRREAFVEAAWRLIQAKGYEQMSVQDVLDALDASRGAFYHYFDSKAALLQAVVERMVEESTAALAPVVADSKLSALDKLGRVFAGVARYKHEQKDLVLGFMRVWLSDDNVLARDKLRQATASRLGPLLAAILRQGRAEGVFTTTSPDDTARVLVSLWLALNEFASELFLAREAKTITLEAVEHTLRAHLEAFERILGIPDGSLPTATPFASGSSHDIDHQHGKTDQGVRLP
jgi:AcrR family transcriptional regulator